MRSKPHWSRPARQVVTLALVLALVVAANLTLASCRPKPADGPGAGGAVEPGGAGPDSGTVTVTEGPAPLGVDNMPPAVVAQEPDGRQTVAVGPFTDLLDLGAVSGTDLAWGLGNLAGGRQVYFTVDPSGAVNAIGLSPDANVTVASPLRGAQPNGIVGMVAVHYSDFTAYWYPVASEGKALGSANAVKISPNHKRILVFGRDGGNQCWTVADWTSSPVPAIPVSEFPFAGIGTDWVGDDVVSVRLWGPSSESEGLPADTGIIRLLKMPGGEVLGDLQTPGDILSPIPSPDGRYLAVLHIASASAVVLPESFYPADFGQSLDVYEVSALLGAGNLSAVKPVATFQAPADKFLTGVVWAPDGSRLVYAETNYGVDTEGLIADDTSAGTTVPVPDRRSTVWVATAPSFVAVDAGLPEGYWSPLAISPDGTRFVVGNDAALGGYIWDIAAKRGVALPATAGHEALSPAWLVWVNNDFLAGSDEPRYEFAQPVFVRASDGQVVDEGIPTSPFYYPTGKGIVLRTTLEADGPLGPFPTLAAGQWLFYVPVPAGQ